MATASSIIDFVANWRNSKGIAEGGKLTDAQILQLATELQGELAQLDYVPDGGPESKTLIIYQGTTANRPSWQVAREISQASDGSRYYIGDTEAGVLLNSQAFKNALGQAVGDGSIALAMINGAEIDGVRSTFGFGNVLSVNDFCSRKLVENASGELIVLTHDPIDPHKVMGASELQSALNNPDLHHINGIPREAWVALDAGSRESVHSVLLASSIMYGAHLQIDAGNGVRKTLLETAMSSMGQQRFFATMGAAAEALSHLSMATANTLGVIGDAIEVFSTAYKVTTLLREGDSVGATRALTESSLTFTAGWAGATRAAALANNTFGFMRSWGPLGVLGWTTIVLTAGYFGGKFGVEAVERFLPSGPAGDPMDAKQAIAIASQDDALGLAMRQAMYFFNPFAVLTEEGSSVDLSLYDPVTRTGQITREWIEARATALTAYTLYLSRRETDGVLSMPLGLPFYRDGDTLITDSELGNENALRIDGLPITSEIRFVRFGNAEDNTLLGSGRDDKLFGSGGEDLLVGDGGNDYLEGGADNDELRSGAGNDILDGGTGDDEYVVSHAAAMTTIRDADGAGRITLEQADGTRVTLGPDIHQVGNGGQYRDEDGNRYYRRGADLIISRADGGGMIIVEDYGHMPGARLGLDLQVEDPDVPPNTRNYTVGAPNQLLTYPAIVNGDETAFNAQVEAMGLYTGWFFSPSNHQVPGDEIHLSTNEWLSPGEYFARRDTEVISVAAAIVDQAHDQHAYARVVAGMGDSYITGDDSINFIIDDSESHFGSNSLPARDLWPVGTAGIGLFPVAPNLALGIWGGNYAMSSIMGNDRIEAGGGDDIVITRGGNDLAYGGEGNDVLFDAHGGGEARWNQSYTYEGVTAQGVTYIYAFDSLEWIEQEGHSSNDALFGDGGNDYLAGHGGRQMLDGGTGNDEAYGGADHDVLIGGDGEDVLAGDLHLQHSPLVTSFDALGNPITVLDGNSLISEQVKYGNDTLEGGAGSDTLIGGGGNDALFGGDDDDYIDGDFTQALTNPALRSGLRNLTADPVQISGNDLIFGEGGNDTLYGGGGDDLIDGGVGNDHIFAGTGDDLVRAGVGADIVTGDEDGAPAGRDEIHGGDGSDTLDGGGEADRLYGDEGDDFIHGDGTSTQFGADWIEGGVGNDHLYGEGGNDVLSGGAGYDELYGGAGNDTLHADTGQDRLDGGAGNDTYVLGPGAGLVTIVDTEGSNTLHFTPDVANGTITLRRRDGMIYIGFGSTDAAVMDQATFNTLTPLKLEDQGVSLSTSEISIAELLRRFEPETVTDGAIRLATGVAAAAVTYASRNDDLILLYSGAVPNWLDRNALTANNVQHEWRPASDYGLSSPNNVLVLTNWYRTNPATYVHELLETGGTRLDFTSTANSIERRFSLTEVEDELAGTANRDVVFALGGDDVINGNAGNDSLDGGDGADQLTGDAGNDSLFGRTGDDTLFGGDGDDFLDAAEGQDHLSGGANNDTLRGRQDDDVLFGDDAQDSLFGDEGNDFLSGGAGHDALEGGSGDDMLVGGEGNDTYRIGVGNGADTIVDFDSNNTLSFLSGITEADISITESAAGLLVTIGGAASGNSVFIRSGLPAGPARPISLFQFASGASWNSTQIDAHITGNRAPRVSQLIPYPTAQQGVPFTFTFAANTFTDPDVGDVITYTATRSDGTPLPAWLQFNPSTRTFSGTRPALDVDLVNIRVIATDQAGAAGSTEFLLNVSSFQILGSSADNFLGGTSSGEVFIAGAGADTVNAGGGNDRLFGEAGNDTLAGEAGNDLMIGGTGADVLIGGDGDDTYHYGVGDGADIVRDTAGTADALVFGPGIAPTDLVLTETSAGLQVQVGAAAGGNTLLIERQTGIAVQQQPIESFRFDDGTVWSSADIDAHVTGNRSPRAAGTLAELRAPAGQPFTFVLPATLFTDPNAGDQLTFSLLRADGQPLPAWLSFDPQTRTLSGTPQAGDIGVQSLVVRAADPGGLYGDLSFGLRVPAVVQLTGTANQDWLTASTPDTYVIEGLAGNDVLTGGAGDDILIGGADNDWLNGGGGSDLYVYNRGDGADEIDQNDTTAGKVDTLRFGAGITPDQVEFVADSLGFGDLRIRIRNPDGTLSATDSIFIRHFLVGEDNAGKIDRFEFASAPGVVYTAAQIESLVMVPTAGHDYLRLTNGDDVIHGGAGTDRIFGLGGNDQLFGDNDIDVLVGGAGDDLLVGGAGGDDMEGGAGSDTYLYQLGDGSDVIRGHDDDASAIDTIQFGAGIAPGNVRVLNNSGSLVLIISVPGAEETTINVLDGFHPVNGAGAVDRVVFADGTVWDRAALAAMSLIGNDQINTIVGYDTDDVLLGMGHDDLLRGGAGNDQLRGGTGFDELVGEAGNDTYLFGRGEGYDEILDTAGVNRIVLDAGIAPGDVTLYRVSGPGQLNNNQFSANSESLLVSINDREHLLVQNQYTASGYRAVTQIVFADGTVWDEAQIQAQVVNLAGVQNVHTVTTSNDSYSVDHHGDQIPETSNGGVDTVTSTAFTYTLPNNVENLILSGPIAIAGNGNTLNNVLTGNALDNVLNGGIGVDVMIGGAGDDTYYVDADPTGFPIYGGSPAENPFDDTVELAGEGYDTVIAQNPYSFELADNVEAVVVFGRMGITTAHTRDFFGNALDNVIDLRIANSRVSDVVVVDGRGGADLMIGQSNRTTRFIVDNVGDVVRGGTQVDTVRSSVTYTLPDSVEVIELTGTAAINAYGSYLGNTLNGSTNTASNLLAGGLGNDTYIIGANDVVQENVDAGIDTVQIANAGFNALYDLAMFANVENLSIALTGTGGRILGSDAANVLTGASVGGVIFEGRGGDDRLVGGSGEDWYVVDLTSGHDVIASGGGNDRLYFSDTIDLPVSALQFTRVGNDLLIGASATSSVRIEGWYQGARIERLDVFQNGMLFRYDATQIEARVSGTNSAPTPGAPLIGDLIPVGGNFSITLPANAFYDIESQGQLTLSATMADGSPLLSWMAFDPVTRTVSGTVPLGTNGSLELLITATDAGGLSASQQLTLDTSIIGSEGDDVLTGSAEDDVIDGRDGNDTIDGLGGADLLFGGAGADTLHGGDAEDWLEGGDGNDVLFGGADTDELYGDADNDELNGEDGADFVYGGTGNDILRGGIGDDEIEGEEGDDQLFGGDGADSLAGWEGNDVLDGGAGADIMNGGDGDDLYVDAAPEDAIIDNDGIDEVRASVTYFLTEGIENLTLTGNATIDGTGNELDNILLGNSAVNILNGDNGNDTLNGGAGNDTLRGGDGDDIYIVETGDTVTEFSGDGYDTVYASSTWTLSSSVEALILTGTGNINGTGNGSANYLEGNAGNNQLSGGSGADEMHGGLGNDTYIVDNAGDTIGEEANEGTDTVTLQAAIVYALGANLENLTLTNSAINGTGNDLDNVLTGNSAANTLTGGAGNDTLNGGSSNDSMIGGTGNDTYVVAQTGDTVTELAGEGIDLVQSSVAFTLSNDVENLTLTTSSAANGTGNGIDNVLIGGGGSNTLMGLAGNDTLNPGSGGTDSLQGGQGDDIYVISRSSGVTVVEVANEGTDTIQASLTYTLGNNVENLALTGSNAINGTGNSLNNVITGNVGNNTLNGGTGSGNDTLIGAAGNDTLVGGNGADIYSYSSGHGTDVIDNSSTDSAQDRLDVTNLTRAEMTFSRSGNDLLIARNGTPTDSVRVTNWFTVTGNQLDFVQFTDQTLTAAQINALFGGSLLAGADARVPEPEPEFDSAVLRFIDAMNLFARDDRLASDVRSIDRQYPDAALTGSGRQECMYDRHERLVDTAPV